MAKNAWYLGFSCAALALGCGGGSATDADAVADAQFADQAVDARPDTPSGDAVSADVTTTDAGADVTTTDATTTDVTATDVTTTDAGADVTATDATATDVTTLDAGADVTTDATAMDGGTDVAPVDSGADVLAADLAIDARVLDVYSDLPGVDVAPSDLGVDALVVSPDVSVGVDAGDAGGCVPRMAATATMQRTQGGYGPVLALDPLGFTVISSRNRTTDPGVLYFARYSSDGALRGSVVESPVANMGRLGGLVWDGERYHLTYYRSSDRAILLAGMTSTGSLESSPIVITAGTSTDTERAPMTVNTGTGERCVMWRQRGLGTAPPILHATIVGKGDISEDSILDTSPSDGFEVTAVYGSMYRCLFVWSAAGAIRAIGLPGGTATTIVPASGGAARTMATVAAVATADRYVVAWNELSGDAPGLYALPIDGRLSPLGAARRVETLAAGVTVRRLAVGSAPSGYDLVTERTDGDTFVQRVSYASDGAVTAPAVRVVNVCIAADALAERLPVATQGARRYGAFMDLRVTSSVVATF